MVAPGDAPKVRNDYASAGLLPPPTAIVPTIGATVGQAVVMASAGMRAEASDLEWFSQTQPALLGQDIGAIRYEAAVVRGAGSVVPVDLTTP